MTRALAVDRVLLVPARGGFFFDDQAAIHAGAGRDGLRYLGDPVTAGFGAIREPAEAVSVMLLLSDGAVVTGDAATVQYSGVAGREPRLRAAALIEQLQDAVVPGLIGLAVSEFREADQAARGLTESLPQRRAADYGISQALLAAAAHAASHGIPAWTIQKEWGLDGPLHRPPIYAQSGEDRYDNVDKMILKGVEVLPHGLINTPALVGPDGALLEEYVGWVAGRVAELGAPGYRPVLHFDVYGQVGVAAGGDLARAAELLCRLERAAAGYELRIEHPVGAESRQAQVHALATLRELLAQQGSAVRIVADEWANDVDDIAEFCRAGAADLIQIKTPDLGSLANTVDAALMCRDSGVGVVLGGTCAETDVSARACTHVAMAVGATQVLAKPGMGVDEPLMIVDNEMARTLALDAALGGRPGS